MKFKKYTKRYYATLLKKVIAKSKEKRGEIDNYRSRNEAKKLVFLKLLSYTSYTLYEKGRLTEPI